MTPKVRKQSYKKFLKASNGSVLLATDLVARGIDIDSIKWIVQFDCPQDPAFFTHRVGRTARGGKSGNSIAMICPNEVVAYIPYLENKGVHLTKHEAPSTIEFDTCKYLRENMTEIRREDLLKATAGFVSFVRAYQEHKLRYIFELKEVNLGHVAQSFGALRVPRVKEILGKHIDDFERSEIASDSVPYTCPKKEAERLIELAQKKETEVVVVPKKKIKEEPERRTRSDKRKAKRRNDDEHWDSLQAEERLAKKLRIGKITKEEYEAAVEGIEYSGDDTESETDEIVSCVVKKVNRRKKNGANHGSKRTLFK